MSIPYGSLKTKAESTDDFIERNVVPGGKLRPMLDKAVDELEKLGASNRVKSEAFLLRKLREQWRSTDDSPKENSITTSMQVYCSYCRSLKTSPQNCTQCGAP